MDDEGVLGSMTEREYEALRILRRYGQGADCPCRMDCDFDGGHPFLGRLARQKERELLDLTLDARTGATVVEPRPKPRQPAKPPMRRVAQRKGKVRIENGWLRALGRVNSR